MIKRIIGYLLAGLVTTLPIILTLSLFYYLISKLQEYFYLQSAFLGLIVIVLVLILIGYFTSSYIGTNLWLQLEAVLMKVPLFRQFYKGIKDVTTAFVGTENKFSEPVLVKMTDQGVYKMGFITNRDIGDIIEKDSAATEGETNTLISVYFPLSLSLSGDLFLVPLQNVQMINRKSSDVMQSIISGGLVKIPNLK